MRPRGLEVELCERPHRKQTRVDLGLPMRDVQRQVRLRHPEQEHHQLTHQVLVCSHYTELNSILLIFYNQGSLGN